MAVAAAGMHQPEYEGEGDPIENYIKMEDDEFYYPDRIAEKGVAIIINNWKFDKHPQRHTLGARQDKETLMIQLKSLGFKHPIEHENLSIHGMKNELNIVSMSDADISCVFVAILSYGEAGQVYGTDGKLSYQDIYEQFTFRRCPRLKDKPKIFLIQTTYANDNLIPSHHGSDAGPTGEVLSRQVTHNDIPPEENFLLFCSLTPDRYAWEPEKENGTYFIQKLCEILQRDGKRITFMDILTRATFMTVRYYNNFLALNPGIKHRYNPPYIKSTLHNHLTFQDGSF